MNRSLFGLFALLIVGNIAHAEDVPDPFGPSSAPSTARTRAVFVPEPGGVRVLTPPPALTRLSRLPRQWAAPSGVALGGDFEFSASFDVLKLGGPAAEGGAHLSVIGATDYRPYGVQVSVHPADGRCFRVMRFAPNSGGMHWNTVVFPRQSDRGRVALRRRGAEIVFLAADGPDAPLVELVRYPHDPRLSPTPQLGAEQDWKADPAPVDVRFTDIKVQADRVERGPLTAGLAPVAAAEPRPLPTPAAYPVTVDYGANAARLFADFPRGHGAAGGFRADPGGVRVKPPHGVAGADAYWARESRFVVSGDFEVQCKLDPAGVGPPSPTGDGTCGAGFSLETDGPVGSVTVAYVVVRGEGPRYGITRLHPTKKGQHWDIQRVPAGGRPTRLAVRRTGADMVVSAHEDGQSAPVELVRFPFPPGLTPRVRLFAYQGGPPPAPVDVLVSEVRVRAARVADPDDPDTAAAPSPGEAAAAGVVLDGLPAAPGSRKWRYLAWAAAAILLAALVGGVFAWRSRRAGAQS